MEPHSHKIEDLIDRYIKNDCLALDVGCGIGINTSRLKKKTKKITGFDIADFVKDKYRTDFKFILGNGNSLPFEDNSFDLITSWDVIEHVEDDQKFLKEMYRVLKSGGILMLSTPNKDRLSNRLLKLFGKKINYPYYLGTEEDEVGEIWHLREYTGDELKGLMEDGGFKTKEFSGVYLGFHGFLKIGIFRVPQFLQKYCQHLFIVLAK